MMNRTALLSLIAVTAFASSPAMAQDANDNEDRTSREDVARLPSIEAVMAMRERLSLTDDQIARLDDLRAESVERRSAAQAEVAEMRSRLAAGQIQRSEMMAFIEDRQAQAGDVREEQRARLESVLDATQLETLLEARGRTRAFARGRASARRGGRDGLRGPRSGIRSGRSGLRSGRGGIRSERSFRGARSSRWDGSIRDFRRAR